MWDFYAANARELTSVLADVKADYKKLQRDSIIKINEEINKWYHIGLNTSDLTYTEETDGVRIKLLEIESMKAEVWRAHSNLSLFLADDNLKNEIYVAIKEVQEYSHFTERFLLQYYHKLQKKDTLQSQLKVPGIPDNEKEIKKAELNRAWDEIGKVYDEYSSSRREKFMPANAARIRLEQLSQKKLAELLN